MGLTFRPVAARSFWAQPVLLDEFRGLAQPGPRTAPSMHTTSDWPD